MSLRVLTAFELAERRIDAISTDGDFHSCIAFARHINNIRSLRIEYNLDHALDYCEDHKFFHYVQHVVWNRTITKDALFKMICRNRWKQMMRYFVSNIATEDKDYHIVFVMYLRACISGEIDLLYLLSPVVKRLERYDLHCIATGFQYAIRSGNLDCARYIHDGIDSWFHRSIYQVAFYDACRNGDIDVVNMLLTSARCAIRINLDDEKGMRIACITNNVRLVRLLTELTDIDYSVGEGVLVLRAACHGAGGEILDLVDRSSRIDDVDRYNLYAKMLWVGNFEGIKWLYLQDPEWLIGSKCRGYSTLARIIHIGYRDIAEWMIAKGYDIHANAEEILSNCMHSRDTSITRWTFSLYEQREIINVFSKDNYNRLWRIGACRDIDFVVSIMELLEPLPNQQYYVILRRAANLGNHAVVDWLVKARRFGIPYYDKRIQIMNSAISNFGAKRGRYFVHKNEMIATIRALCYGIPETELRRTPCMGFSGMSIRDILSM